MKITRKHIIAGVVGIGAAAIIGLHGTPTNQCHSRQTDPNNRLMTLQDATCTPGATDSASTTQKLCDPNFRTGTIRNVTESEKQQVYAEYDITSHKPGEYEIDHLISLELGGSNDIKNLWPENGFPNPKDQVENKLHKEVCTGQITLQEAQKCISTNWEVCK